MPDVTINQLNTGTPNKNSAVIPYSDGTTTLKTSPSGIVAASPGSIINVGNVLNETTYTFFLPTNTDYVNTGMSVSYKPLFSTSKILVQAHIYGQKYYLGGNYNVPMVLQLRRGANVNLTNYVGSNAIASNGENLMSTYSFSVIDTPNTTNNVVYTIWAKTTASGYGGEAYINKLYSNHPGVWTSMFTFFEIAG